MANIGVLLQLVLFIIGNVNARLVPESEFLCPQRDMSHLKHECLPETVEECLAQDKDYIEHCQLCCRWGERPALTDCKVYECGKGIDQFCGLTGNNIYLGSCAAGLYCQSTYYGDVVSLHTCQKLPDLKTYNSSADLYKLPSLFDWGQCMWFYPKLEVAMYHDLTKGTCHPIPKVGDSCTPLAASYFADGPLPRSAQLDLYYEVDLCGIGHYKPGVMRCSPASRKCEYIPPDKPCGASLPADELFATCSPGYECLGDFTLPPDQQLFKCTRKAKWGEPCGFPGKSCANANGKAICYSPFVSREIIPAQPDEARYEAEQMFINQDMCDDICGGRGNGTVMGEYYCECKDGRGCGTDKAYLLLGQRECPIPEKHFGFCQYDQNILYAEEDWPCFNGHCSTTDAVPLVCNSSGPSPSATCVNRNLSTLEWGKMNGMVTDFDYGIPCELSATEPITMDPLECDCQCGPEGKGVCKNTHAPDIFSRRCMYLEKLLETCIAERHCTYLETSIGNIPGCRECYSSFAEYAVDCFRAALNPPDFYCIADAVGYDINYKNSRIASGVFGLIALLIMVVFAVRSAIVEYRARLNHIESRNANLKKIEEEQQQKESLTQLLMHPPANLSSSS